MNQNTTGGRRRWMVAGVVVVLVVAAGGAALATGAVGGSPAASGAGASSGYSTGTATVTRQTLTSQTQVTATLGDGGSWNVTVPSGGSSAASSPAAGGGSGTLTWLPAAGQVIRQGHEIYAVSGSAVVLLYGAVPAYRDLSEGMTGADVTELNTDLVTLGYATSAALGPRSGWDYYSAETAYAVELLQAKLGLTETGTLTLGEAAFLPGPALITGLGTTTVLGGPATSGSVVLTASSTTPVVTIDLDASQQSEVKDGDSVSITLPDGSTTSGTVTQVSRVASASSSSGSSGNSQNSSSNGSQSGSAATIAVLVSLTHPKDAGTLNQAPVTVTITTASVPDALTVPVDALLAESGGAYAVEVTGPGGHHLVRVTPGLFDDAAGLVQVSGNLTPGQHVVVPGI
ncbi:MAG TPA: hypothetical protein VHY31_08330 [Streptosporangiaceae bacterium]|nr:hypothetical protein [Streptosporangiaceae bacterium]